MTEWLIDTSALVRLSAAEDAEDWVQRIGRGLVRSSTVTRLEVGYSARSGIDLRSAARRPPLAVMPVEYLTPLSRTEPFRSSCCWPTTVAIARRRSQICSSRQQLSKLASPSCMSIRIST